jgi:hypothetical protein
VRARVGVYDVERLELVLDQEPVMPDAAPVEPDAGDLTEEWYR